MDIVPLRKDTHAKARIRQSLDYAFAVPMPVVPVIAAELARIIAQFPLAFAPLRPEEPPVPCAVMGFDRTRNLMVRPDGRWRGGYVPSVLRRYPFLLARTAEGDQMALCIDRDSGLLSETDGERLFDDDGARTAYFEDILKLTTEIETQLRQMVALMRKVLEIDAEILKPVDPPLPTLHDKTAAHPPGTTPLKGIYQVDETRLNSLPDEAFLALRQAGALPLLYGQLASLGQWSMLARLYRAALGETPPDSLAIAPEGEDWELSFD